MINNARSVEAPARRQTERQEKAAGIGVGSGHQQNNSITSPSVLRTTSVPGTELFRQQSIITMDGMMASVRHYFHQFRVSPPARKKRQ